MIKQYESVYIMNPVLSDEMVKDTVVKFEKVLKENGAEIVHQNTWGLRKLAYPIQKKSTGIYHLVEFKAPSSLIAKLELEFKRDEKIMRFLTIVLDKHSILYNDNKRQGISKFVKTEAPTV